MTDETQKPEPGISEVDAVEIRRAVSSDTARLNEALAALSADLGDGHRIADADLLAAGFGSAPGFVALLAERNGAIVGIAVFSQILSTTRGAPGVFLSDFWVAEALRGAGTGRKLLAAVCDLAAEKWGAAFIKLAVYRTNHAAREAYERFGFTASKNEIAMSLDGGAFKALRGNNPAGAESGGSFTKPLSTPLIDKSSEMATAIAEIGDGMTIMIGGFGVPGTPFCLIEELVRLGPKGLTIVKNDANERDMGVDWLLANGQVKKLITSHIGLNSRAVQMMNDGLIEVEFVAQGILAERIRAGGAGLSGIVTDIGIGTLIAADKKVIDVDGVSAIFEPALKADFALVHADRADTFGNLTYAAAARNFNPLIAMAADCTIAEAEAVVTPGAIAPEHVHTPGPFVDKVVELAQLPEVYGVVER